MPPISETDIVLRLVISCILGGLIGFERENLERPAGLRTHILVCVGSALIMLVSIYGFANYETVNKDPGRIAAQVVSGIGFLGAGTILREGLTVTGLTTAASLWVVAGIGLAIGSGLFFVGIAGTALVFLTLVLFGQMERRHWNRYRNRIKIVVRDQPGQLGRIALFFGQHNISIKNVTMHHILEQKVINLEFVLIMPADTDMIKIFAELTEIDGVLSIDKSW
ncbi:MgtC/SapB family protein [Sporomusa acidovorans]|uniref:Protein SapB n=1 Tax=Sporomusa acidovorans (strain ATCC 49682 / DSM 3132 / Mol) TaxID=1123286 RepID=A0ABZ3J2J7_SPOA4|nr:MgtC/SapB family protein [Sporomusa acidovorans]OZC20105.1 putative Mg(2+) transport ATPase [Sporomusa acidovorans DSM 3132]SDD45069.1 putative Mg2+ transporter-C (MgtC) family protein [Sporomusa acidovorans]